MVNVGAGSQADEVCGAVVEAEVGQAPVVPRPVNAPEADRVGGPGSVPAVQPRKGCGVERFRNEPDLVVPLIEEVLRYEPSVQFIPFTIALSDIDIAGTTIPKGAQVWLLLASANRDPKRFEDPDRFDPDREDNQHLGFYIGIHYCFGAPLARMEAQLALPQLFRRIKNPRLVADPPPYRVNPVLRGPRHLPVAIDALTA